MFTLCSPHISPPLYHPPPPPLQLKQIYQYYSSLGASETDDIFTISLEQVRSTKNAVS
jgi:hypothetical protein